MGIIIPILFGIILVDISVLIAYYAYVNINLMRRQIELLFDDIESLAQSQLKIINAKGLVISDEVEEPSDVSVQ